MTSAADIAVMNALIAEVGETDAGALASVVAAQWQRWAFKAQTAPELQWAYVKRALIDTARGEVRQQIAVTLAGSEQLQLQQKRQALDIQHKEITDEIAIIEQQYRTSRVGVAAAITRTEPLTPADVLATPYTWPLDANDPRVIGSPYYRPRRRYGYDGIG